MAKWEHMTIAARYDGYRLKPWFINGVQVQKWKSWPSVEEYLDQLGEERWELVNVTEGLGDLAFRSVLTAARGRTYHLKRPIP